jgi:hypothetical protein
MFIERFIKPSSHLPSRKTPLPQTRDGTRPCANALGRHINENPVGPSSRPVAVNLPRRENTKKTIVSLHRLARRGAAGGGQRRTKSALGPPGALLALPSSCGQTRTEAVIRGHNPVALAACSPRPPKRIGGVPRPKADKNGDRGQRADHQVMSIFAVERLSRNSQRNAEENVKRHTCTVLRTRRLHPRLTLLY